MMWATAQVGDRRMIKTGFELLKLKVKQFIDGEAGMMEVIDVIRVLVVAVVMAAIGVFIADKTVTATGTVTDANLSAFRNNTLGAANTGSSFVVILIIAFIGGLAITYLYGAFYGGKGRR